jgi:hypothetical protein
MVIINFSKPWVNYRKGKNYRTLCQRAREKITAREKINTREKITAREKNYRKGEK